jgi:uncharacterized RDD family membrane protein YckC
VSAAPQGATPGLARRLASALYDLLLVAALVLVATFPFLAIVGDATQGWRRHLLQAWVLGVSGAYFVWFWTHGGRTLAMKTWRIRLVAEDGRGVNTARAIHRFAVAALGLGAAGIGFAWALVDRDRQFLHDRLSGTRLVHDAASASPRAAGAPPPPSS